MNTPPYAADNLLMGDALHESAMQDGSRALANSIRLARGGTVTRDEMAQIVRMRRRKSYSQQINHQINPNSQNAKVTAAALAKSARDHAIIAALRIEPRDPCPRCGTRGDVGCKHGGASQ